MRSIAIVTGASSGVGKEFIHQLEAGGGGPLDEIWAIARRQDRLDAIRQECKTPVRTFALDLTDPASFDTIDAALSDEPDVVVQWLMNCAGYGKYGDLREIPEKDNAGMVRLNCLAVVEMCYRCLPYMRPGSRIINMASVAALVPQPGISVYSASKRFVLDLSRSLDEELRSVGIHVTAVCPKYMNTEFLSNPGDQVAVDRTTFIGFENPQNVVREALAAAVRGWQVCVPSWDMKVVHVLSKILPTRFLMAGERFMGDWTTERFT